jgi:flagellin-like protein
MMNYRKIRKNVKAVSPVISVLLMIVVAVAASLVTYAWVMGYMGFTTNKVGKAIMIQAVAQDGTVSVQNVGDSRSAR